MVVAFTKMTKEEFSLTDLSNGPVVEAVYRSCRCAGPEYICCLGSRNPEFLSGLPHILGAKNDDLKSIIQSTILTGPCAH
jgi:hypothetical protein